MQVTKTLLSLVSASVFAVTAHAQQITISQNVVFALTETYSAPALPDRNEVGAPIRGAAPVFSNIFSVTSTNGQITTITTEEGSKMAGARISNKEILLDLVQEKVIQSIIGYSIQLRGVVGPDGSVQSKFHVVKNGETPIDISQYLFVESSDDSRGNAKNYSYRKVETNSSSRETITGRANGKEQISLKYESSSVKIEMDGISNWSETYRNVLAGQSLVSLWAPGPGSVTTITGKLEKKKPTPNVAPGPNVIEGTVTIGVGLISVNPL